MNPSSNFLQGLSVPSLKTQLIINTMKKIGIIILMVTIILQAFSQEVVSKEKQPEKKTVKDSVITETVKVTMGDEVFSIKENQDAVRIRLGDNGLTILESLEGGSKIRWEKYDDDDYIVSAEDDQDERRRMSRNRFKGNWAGIEFGFNGYFTDDFSSVMPDDIYYMTLHSGKSNSFSINFIQQSLGFARHFGMVTGLGLEWNNYRFDGNNNIEKDENGNIIVLDPGVTLKKSRLKTLYLNIPLLLDVKIPADNNHFNVAAGLIGGVKLWSESKMVTDDDRKLQSNSDFSLSVLRWGTTARIGFGNFQIFGTYYFTPMFKPGKGPGGHDLYPVEIGFALTFSG